MALKDLKLNDETSGDLGGYFHVTITDLDLATQYPLEFQYIYSDKRQNDNWSAVKYFTTLGATVPNDPQLQSTDVVGGAGFVKVSWSGNDASGNPIANFDRVDVHISGTTFGDGTKPAGSFKTAGTQSFTCVAGTYIVQLKVYSLNGESSFFSTARTVTVTAVGEAIDTPVSPSSSGFSSRRILGGLEVSWDGTYGSSWSGFSAINIYAGTSSSATSGTYIKVGQMTANRVTNKIVVPVDGTYVRYGEPVYIHASSVNKNDVESSIVANVTSQSSGAARATDSDINDGAVSFAKLAANTLTVDNLSAGTINSTAFIRAGTAGSARVEMSSAAISGGPAAGFYIYNSAGTAVLSAPLSGGLSINGGGTFTGALSAATGTFAGTLSAATGSFSGTITASAGSIGGVIIASDAIQNGSTSSNSTFRLDNTGKARFGTATGNAIILNPAPSAGGYYIYHSSNGGGAASGKFSVSDGGVLTATGATFSGTITNSTSSDYWNADGTFRFGGSSGISYSGGTITMGSSVTMPAAQITGTLTAGAVDTTSLDIASTGAITTTSGKFGVTSGGVLTATEADLSGAIKATSGFIGNSTSGWIFHPDGYLYNGTAGSSDSGTTLYPTGALNVFALITNREIWADAGFTSKYGNSLEGNGTSTNNSWRSLGDIEPESDNLWELGASGRRWIRLYAVNSTINTSDYRIKTDISDASLGLNFINSLRPVSYKYIVGAKNPVRDSDGKYLKDKNGNVIYEERPGVRTHWGLIAQEVKQAVDSSGVEDFAGWVKDDMSDPDSMQSLAYEQFISPIIKAIQELSQRLDALEA
jgi:hypothetical protein